MNKAFIIGAGASFEVGLPLGGELLEEIGGLLNFEFKEMAIPPELMSGDFDIYNAILEKCKRENHKVIDYLEAAKHISRTASLNASIDNLINKNNGNSKLEFVAKLSITKLILKNEKESDLSFEKSRCGKKINYKSISDSWHLPFYKMLTERCTAENLVERFEKITLIIFNYDRCIEHFLFESIKADYDLNDIEAAAIVDSLSIYHPYGSVGVLPKLEMECEGNQVHVGFGKVPISNKLHPIATGIKTFTEGTDPDDSLIIDIRSKLYNADKVVFLGFGFESLNMELLTATDKSNPSVYKRPVYATMKGISKDNCNYVTKDISKLFDGKCHIRAEDMTCFELMNQYSNGLSILKE